MTMWEEKLYAGGKWETMIFSWCGLKSKHMWNIKWKSLTQDRLLHFLLQDKSMRGIQYIDISILHEIQLYNSCMKYNVT